MKFQKKNCLGNGKETPVKFSVKATEEIPERTPEGTLGKIADNSTGRNTTGNP